MILSILHLALLGLAATHTAAQEITTALTLETPSTGVSTTPDGRIFIIYARVDGSTGPQIVEWKDNTSVPYPNEAWNSWNSSQDPGTGFVRVNSQRIGPDGNLWLVDTGSPGFGEPVLLPNGPKLIQVDTTTNQVSKIYNMGNVTLPQSLLDDVRFNGDVAYFTDAGAPALIVLDLVTGEARRILENAASTTGYGPVSAEGTLLHAPDGSYEYIYADQLEVSPNGTYLYYQPCSGGMSRIETQYLNNVSLSDAELAAYVEPYSHTPSTGGTAIDADGNIYNSDTDRQTILKIAPNGTNSVFLQDPSLLWIDAMWIDSQNRLWMPAAQLNRGATFNNGTNHIVYPLHVYTVDIGVGPSPIDHA